MEKNSFKLLIFHVISLHCLCMHKMSSSSSAQCCETRYCNSVNVEFPFYDTSVQAESCGCPRFGLYCDNELGLLLELPHAGNFSVDYILYYSRTIKLSDPMNECIAAKLLNLDLTTTPFRGSPSLDYWVYNCSEFDLPIYTYNHIDCLSGSGYTVVSGRSNSTITHPNCTLLKHLSVPTSSYRFSFFDYSSIYLTWDQHHCDSCAEPHQVVWKVVLGIISSISFILICYGILQCKKQRNESATTRITNTTENTTATSAPTSSGLDQITIDSYPTVTLVDNGSLSKPDNDMCPICLSEYSPDDALKILPHCLHRFHADCIDIWLKSQPTCPICRTSPQKLAHFLA